MNAIDKWLCASSLRKTNLLARQNRMTKEKWFRRHWFKVLQPRQTLWIMLNQINEKNVFDLTSLNTFFLRIFLAGLQFALAHNVVESLFYLSHILYELRIRSMMERVIYYYDPWHSCIFPSAGLLIIYFTNHMQMIASYEYLVDGYLSRQHICSPSLEMCPQTLKTLYKWLHMHFFISSTFVPGWESFQVLLEGDGIAGSLTWKCFSKSHWVT